MPNATAIQALFEIQQFLLSPLLEGRLNASSAIGLAFLTGTVMQAEYPRLAEQLANVLGLDGVVSVRQTVDCLAGDMKKAGL